MENCWIYRGKCLESPPEGYYGYLYSITTNDGRIYFGKKAFSFKKKRKLSKKARIGTRKRVEIKQVDSGWEKYYGSCKPLIEYLKINNYQCQRHILMFCQTRQDLAYYETKLLINQEVLFRDDCWNSNVASRYFKGKINKI